MAASIFLEKTKDDDCYARTGTLTTHHGSVETPAFITVGTKATVKALTPEQLHSIGTQFIIANTYHLFLTPGADILEEMGGVNKFMNWNKPTITDSGGFQAFSLGTGRVEGIGKVLNYFPGGETTLDKPKYVPQKGLVKVNEDGVAFRSHIDNHKIMLTPEKSIDVQQKIGADIILTLDECTSHNAGYDYIKKSLERTHRWALRCIEAHTTNQYLFGIIQGGPYKDLRATAVKFMKSLDFPGYAIGGSLGKGKEDMHQILEWVIPELETDKSRHLLGIGGFDDIFHCVERGIDLFDCVSPTRLARSAMVYISPDAGGCLDNKWRIRIDRTIFKYDKNPIDSSCNCYTCQHFNRAYLHHLFRSKELLAHSLASIHNLTVVENVFKSIRDAIDNNTFFKLKEKWLGKQ